MSNELRLRLGDPVTDETTLAIIQLSDKGKLMVFQDLLAQVPEDKSSFDLLVDLVQFLVNPHLFAQVPGS